MLNEKNTKRAIRSKIAGLLIGATKNTSQVIQQAVCKNCEHMIATYQGCVDEKFNKKQIVAELTTAAEVVLGSVD